VSTATGPAGDCEITQSERFTFHNDPWINLHHFLFEWARGEEEMPERAELETLPANDAAVWQEALDHYRDKFTSRNLTFDRELIEMRTRIGAIACAPARPPVDALLARAMDVYKRRWWPAHRQTNAAWIRQEMSMLRDEERAFARALGHAYGGTWPAGWVRVDVSAYANWAGAYSTNGPDWIVISSNAYKNHLEALEILFHEASHATFLEQPLFRHLAAAMPDRTGRALNLLAHAVQFATPAEILRKRLPEDDRGGFVSIGERVAERGPMSSMYPVIVKHWRAFLGGEIDRDTALERIAAELK
jgi:hypothetical protein